MFDIKEKKRKREARMVREIEMVEKITNKNSLSYIVLSDSFGYRVACIKRNIKYIEKEYKRQQVVIYLILNFYLMLVFSFYFV